MKQRPYDFRLYLVTDRNLSSPRSVDEIVRLTVRGGVTAVQLREKETSTREFIALARKIKELLANTHIPLIINDRVDVALAIDADGVHLGQSDMPYTDARRILGKEKIIGLSVETLDQALEAEKLDVDYLGVSPVFQTPTKTDVHTAWGLDGLKHLRSLSHHTLVAIGGINASNARAVLEAGADGLAVVSALCAAPDPYAAAQELRSIIDSVKGTNK